MTSGGAADEARLQREYGIDIATLRAMYEEWDVDKVPKSVVEARYLRTRRFHGKLFSRLVRAYLGIETEKPHQLVTRLREMETYVEILREQLRCAGLEPVSPPEQMAFKQDTVPEEHPDSEELSGGTD